ncbi:MAG: calcium-binding protein [Hyphomicrobiales bacterium]
MATFNFRTLYNTQTSSSLVQGSTFVFGYDTADYAPATLPKGSHTYTLDAGDRMLSAFPTAFVAGNPGGAYAGSDTFSMTLNINGVMTGTGETIVLQNDRVGSANKITVGKEGMIGGVDGAIRTEAKTDITNSGIISAVDTAGPNGTAIKYDGFNSNLTPAAAVKITNNAGAVIQGGSMGIFYDSLGAITVDNKGIIAGHEGSADDEGEFGAIHTWDGKLTLTNAAGGFISGTVRAGWLGSSVTNAGIINGTIHAHMYGEEEGGPHSNTPLTGFIDYDRDGTPSHADAGDKHWNAITETAMTVTNTGLIDGFDAWTVDSQTSLPIKVALDLTNGKDVVTNSNVIRGAIWTSEGNDTLTNNVGAKIYGEVDLGSDKKFGANSGAYSNQYALDADTLTNKGLIDGNVWTNMGKDTVTNNGEITGELSMGTGNYDAANAKDEDFDTLTNTGLIRGHVWTGLGDDTVTNSGRMDDGLNTSATPGYFDTDQMDWVWFDNDTTTANKDFDNDKDKVTNTGTITGGVSTGHGADTVTNSNLIVGSLNTGVDEWTYDDSDPSGTLTAVDFTNFYKEDTDTVTNSGTVQGHIWTGLGNDTVTNSGYARAIYTSTSAGPQDAYDGDTLIGSVNIVLPGDAAAYDNDIVTNSGTVRDEIWTGIGDDKITNAATGKVIEGVIYGDAGADTITNLGFVQGDVDGGAGGDIITNGGTIGGDVYLGTDVSTNTLTNNKLIEGDVKGSDLGNAAEGNNTITNNGVILGDVLTGSGHDVVKNLGTGRIDGQIHLGGGADEFTGNASNEEVMDEGGGDKYILGAGNDGVVYFSTGIDGSQNTFDGGAGTDTLDMSFLTTAEYTSSIINLSVLATQTASFSGVTAQSDKLSNFENVMGGAGADTITGTAGANDLSGNDGNDILIGGGGQDFLTGGAGDDTFRFTAATDSLAGLADIVFDFGGGDTIDLAFVTGNLIESADFTAQSGGNAQWRVTHMGAITVLEVNNDGDAAPDFVLHLQGNIALGSLGGHELGLTI